MDALFASGHAADIVLIVLALEALWLVARGTPLPTAMLIVLPGALMMLGLRAALTGAPWPWIAVPLALAFPLHIADLRQRGTGGPPPP